MAIGLIYIITGAIQGLYNLIKNYYNGKKSKTKEMSGKKR